MANDYLAWLPAIASFAFVMTFTPGPNNIMLVTSGANFGLKRSMPHVMGVAFGFPAMLIVVAMALVFLPIGIASSWVWAAFGVRIAAILNTPAKLRAFNVAMATALLVAILPVILTY